MLYFPPFFFFVSHSSHIQAFLHFITFRLSPTTSPSLLLYPISLLRYFVVILLSSPVSLWLLHFPHIFNTFPNFYLYHLLFHLIFTFHFFLFPLPPSTFIIRTSPSSSPCSFFHLLFHLLTALFLPTLPPLGFPPLSYPILPLFFCSTSPPPPSFP